MLFKKSAIANGTVFRRINYYTPKGCRVKCFGCNNFLYSREESCKYVDLCSYRIPGNYGDYEKARYYKYVL